MPYRNMHGGFLEQATIPPLSALFFNPGAVSFPFSKLLDEVRSVAPSLTVQSHAEDALATIEKAAPDFIFVDLTGPLYDITLKEASRITSIVNQRETHCIALVEEMESSLAETLQEAGIQDAWDVNMPIGMVRLKLQQLSRTVLMARNLGMLRQAADASGVGIVITDPELPDNPIVYANGSFLELSGYPLDEVLGANCRFLHSGNTDQPEIDQIRRSITERTNCRVRLRNYRKNGEMFWNQLDIKTCETSRGNQYFVGVMHDVSERVNLEEMVTTQKLSAETIDAYPGFFWLLKSPKNWLFINRMAREFVGSNHARGWSGAVHPDDMLNLITALDTAWNENRRTTCELRVRAVDGQWRRIHHTFACYARPDSEEEIIIGSGYDVSEYKASEALLLDRQRYLAALSMIHRVVQTEASLEDQIHSLQEVVAQALNVHDVTILHLPTAGDLSSLPPLNETFDRLTASSDLLGSMSQGVPREIHQDGRLYFLYPVLKQNLCDAIIVLEASPKMQYGRSELDFLQTIGTWLPRRDISSLI